MEGNSNSGPCGPLTISFLGSLNKCPQVSLVSSHRTLGANDGTTKLTESGVSQRLAAVARKTPLGCPAQPCTWAIGFNRRLGHRAIRKAREKDKDEKRKRKHKEG